MDNLAIQRDVVQSFSLEKRFTDNEDGAVNAMDISYDGQIIVTSANDENIRIYDCNKGMRLRYVPCKKYGCDLVRFTNQSKSQVLCASRNGWDETLRHLSLENNCYLRYFKGHRDKVVSISVSSAGDIFLSASLDKSVRLWDLRSPVCQGMLKRTERVAVCFEPEGVAFAAISTPNVVKLYDVRNLDKGPFSTFRIRNNQKEDWRTVSFSPDGKYILLSTASNLVYLLDAFTGEKIQQYTSFVNDDLVLEPCFSPDAQFVLSGSTDGTVHIWDTISGREVDVWHGRNGPVTSVMWNPRLMVVATTATNLSLWAPSKQP